jgi:hypothetical protein
MGKYDQFKFIKKTKARVNHKCSRCRKTINANDHYYAESMKDKFLQSLHSRKFCTECYEEVGEMLIK